MNRRLAQTFTKLMINSNSCTPAFTQMAAIAALRGDQAPVAKMVDTFRKRRDRVVELLNRIEGFPAASQEGLLRLPNVRALGKTSEEIAKLLLDEQGVAVLSGNAFGGTERATCDCLTQRPWKSWRKVSRGSPNLPSKWPPVSLAISKREPSP